MSQTITITIDKRPATLTSKDVGDLVRIARSIDRDATIASGYNPSISFLRLTRKHLEKLGKWLDTHGPEGESK